MRSKAARVLGGLAVSALSLVVFCSFNLPSAQAASRKVSNLKTKTTSLRLASIKKMPPQGIVFSVTSSTANPQLGAHVLFAQNDTFGTDPAITSPIVTQANGSTFLAMSLGWLRNLSNPVDTYNNTWNQVSGPNIYFSPDFYTALWTAPMGLGGSGHTLTFAKTTYPQGEITQELIEVKNGGRVSQIYKLAPSSNQTPGSITVDGPATLIAVWSGDSGALEHTAVPDNGFVVFDSYLSFGGNFETGVQAAFAVKEVTSSGTYTVHWTSNPTQNCACYLIAVQNINTSTPPTSTTFTITPTAGVGGSISPSSSVVVNQGASQTFAITPNTGFQIANVLVDGIGQGTGSSFTFTNVTANHTISVSFSQIPPTTFTITPSAGFGGSISPSSSVVVNQGASQTFAITPSAGFQIASVLVDGLSKGAVSSFTFTNVTASHTIFASFASTTPADTIPPTGTVVINGGASSTNQTAVTLTLSATDNASGVAKMMFSNDGTTFSAPIAFATSAPWVLTNGNGLKTVFARFTDGAGNTSTSTTATINLNSTTTISGLVAYYKFDEGQGTTTTDSSGDGLNGVMANATWVAGKYGKALQFKAQSTSRVTVGNSALLQLTNAYTLSAWVNASSSQVTEPFIVGKEIPGNMPYELYAKGSGIGPNAYAFINGNYNLVGAPSTIPANTWTHLAATYNGSTLSLYVNGVLVSATPVSGSMATGNGALRIGNDAVFSNEGFRGMIDEVRVFNRALSPTEIQSIM